MPFIIVKKGSQAGQIFPLSADEVTIGRDARCTIRLADPVVSRVHAVMRRLPQGGYRIKDNGSSNGLFMNQRRITEADVPDGAVLAFGSMMIEFRSSDHIEMPKEAPQGAGEMLEDFTVTGVFNGSADLVGKALWDAKPEDMTMQSADLYSLNKRLRTAYEVSEIISTTFAPEELYKKILEAIFVSVKVERASIIILNEATGEPITVASQDAQGRQKEVPFSTTIVRKVIENGESLLLSNAQDAEEFEASASIFTMNIRSAMCVPLRTKHKVIGAINADATGSSQFSAEDLKLFTLIGNQAGMAIDNARLLAENLKAARLAAVGETVASLAHCIKNILQGLKGGSYMLDEGLKEGNQEFVSVAWPLVKDSQEKISELVMNMLDYSKDRKPAYESADLRRHMDNLHALMSSRAKEKNVRVILEYDERTPKIDCDPMGIYRATLNLVTNAIDAAEGGGKEVRIVVRPEENNEHIQIVVRDNGTGIPPDVQKKLFQAFQSTKDSKGTGLGLAVTKKIAEEHKGTVSLDTKPGEGTAFTIRVPVRKKE